MKTGPEGVKAGSLYAFAHQAYWGFRYLRDRKEPLWLVIKTATTTSEIQLIGEACSAPNAMPGAGYGAIGAMTWLARDYVARQILAAKEHGQYPKSDRPSSEDRRMIFLGVATSAGIYELSVGTALRKLAEASQGLEEISEHVHRFDHFQEMVKTKSLAWAEPVVNYFFQSHNGEWTELRELPCKVPEDGRSGYFIYGYTESGLEAAFARSVPTEFAAEPETQPSAENRSTDSRPKSASPNHVICDCGATVAAGTRELALKALAEHKRIVHGMK